MIETESGEKKEGEVNGTEEKKEGESGFKMNKQDLAYIVSWY